MSDRSAIEWTDATWNPIRFRVGDRVGWHCEKVSAGCANCYAERLNQRHGTQTSYTRAGSEQGESFLDDAVLQKPLRWRKPRMVFVCSMTDLFGEWVGELWLKSIFGVMLRSPRHTFQVLTKRPGRAAEFLADVKPMPNVWLGVSVEDQKTADERIPKLLECPAAVRFVSYEPALGAVDFERIPGALREGAETCHYGESHQRRECDCAFGIDWIIAGGESGPKARPSHPDIFRTARDQCQAAGVPFFFKQWGEWAPLADLPYRESGYDDVDVDGVLMARVGKKRAGQLLDGREWNEAPQLVNT